MILCAVGVIVVLAVSETVLPPNKSLMYVVYDLGMVSLFGCPILILSMGMYSFVSKDKSQRTMKTGILMGGMSIAMAAIACFVLLMAMVKGNIFVD